MTSKVAREKRRLKRLTASSAPSAITFEPVSVQIIASAGESLPKFNAVAYSGGKLYVKGFSSPVVVDLNGLEVNANATILMDHDSTKRVGHPEEIRINSGKITVSGVISAESDSAREVVSSSKNNYRWQMSIGARVQAAYEVPAGRQVTVNGKVHHGPVIVASKSKLNEISFVGSGGDEDNVVSIAATANGEGTDMTVRTGSPIGERIQKAIDAKGLKIEAAAEVLGVTTEVLSDILTGNEDEPSGSFLKAAAKGLDIDIAELRKLARPEPTAATTPTQQPDPTIQASNGAADAIKAVRDAAASELKRMAEIHKICAGYPDIEAQAVSEGWDEVRAELQVLRESRNRESQLQASSTGVAIHVAGRSTNDPDLHGRAIEASLCLQFNVSEEELAKKHDAKVLELATSRPFRGITLRAMMDRSLRAVGKSLGHGHVDGETIRDFFMAERQLQASAPGSFSTMAATGILANVANKILLDSFTSVGVTVPTVFGRRSVNDFKAHTSYRLGVNGDLDQVGPGGEIHLADLSDESYTHQAKTYGKMLTLTRNNIINDDLGAFDQIPRLLGRKAAIKLEKVGWGLVLSNPSTFFSAGNGNNQTGAATALSIESLTAAEQLFMDQTDAAGDPVMLMPRYLITGTALATTAAELMKETRIIMEQRDTTATSKKATTASNPHAGKWTPIVSPFINSQGLTGSSSTVWYLFADPAEEAAFVVSYLNGRDTPMIESSDLDFNYLGMSWRVVFDFGVDDQETRAAVRSVGA